MRLFFKNKHTACLILLAILFVSILSGEKQFDLNKWQGNYTIRGGSAFDQFGYHIASGDINGDGVKDIIVSSPSADPQGRNSAGQVYIFWGNVVTEQSASIDLNSENADVTIYGAQSGDKLGYSLAVGSFDEDNFADLAISAPYSNNESTLQAGRVYLFYGSQNLPALIDLNNDTADHVFIGELTNDGLGQSLLFTDLNDDGNDELIIGAPEADNGEIGNCGKVYFMWSHETYSPNVNLSQANNITYIPGRAINDNFGKSLETANINNDGIQDLLIGSPGEDEDVLVNNGGVYIIKGRAFFPYGEINLTNSTYINNHITGAYHSSRFGKAIAAGDTNGDGFGDLLITDFSNQTTSNMIFLLYGSNNLADEITLNSDNASSTIIDQTMTDNEFGHKILLKNLMPDTPADIIISSPLASSNNGGQSGLVHILYGREDFDQNYDFSLNDFDEIYHGESANARLGSSLQVTDFNNDTKQDIWLGSIEAGNNKGKAYSIFGGVPWVWNLLPTDGATNVDIDQAIAFSLSDNQQIDLTSLSVNIAGTNYDIDSGNLSYSGSGNFYRITVAPETYFGYNQIINIAIQASDDEGWQIPTTNYRFFTREDTDPPFTNQWEPAPNEQGVPVDTNIEFNVYDLGEGVNISSVVVNVNGTNYYTGNPYFSYLGQANNYRIIINPPSNFLFNEEVSVTIDCEDLAPNPNVMTTFNYSFICGQDTSSPSVILIEPSSGEEVARTNPVFVEVTDSESSLNQNSLVFTLDGENLLPQSEITELSNGRLRVFYDPLENTLLNYGQRELYFYIEDASSNANAIDTTSVFTVIPDNQAPYTANHLPEKFSVDNATNTQFRIDIFDLLSGVDVSTLSILINDNEIVGSESVSISNLNNGYRVIYNPPERLVGEVTVEIQVSDLEVPANTMPIETYTFSTSLDTEAPYISDLYPSEGAINIPVDANLSFKIYDEKTGVNRNSLQVTIDDVDVSEELNIAPITQGFDVLYILEYPYDFDQLVNVYITCSDLEEPANTYENSYYFRVTPDLEPPTLLNFNPQADAQAVPVNTSIFFEIHDNGNGVDIETLEMKVNNQLVEPETTLIPETLFYEVNYVGDDYVYGDQVSVVVSVSDLASTPNTLTNYNYSFTVVDDDQEPPFFTGLQPSEGSTDIPINTGISLMIMDRESGVEANSIIFKVNSTTISNYDLQDIDNQEGIGFRLSYEPDTPFGFGEITRVQIYAMDTSSNNNSANKSYSFTTENDTESPFLDLASPADGGSGYANSHLYLSFKDELSGIDKASFSLRVNNDFVTTYQDSLRDNRLEVWYSTQGFYDIESVEIEYSIADMVGNILEGSYSFSIIPDEYPPYFVWLNPELNSDVELNDYLRVALLDKGVGIDEETISFKLNGRPIENYNLDRTSYNSNPDSLGVILEYQVDDTYYPGENLVINLAVQDKNQSDPLEGREEYNLFIKRALEKDKVEIIPNIISLNFDGINDYSRIIVPTSKKISCKIFNRSGREIADIASTLTVQEDDSGTEYQVAIWDGTNSDKKPVNAGIYICQVKYGDKVHRNTITVAK